MLQVAEAATLDSATRQLAAEFAVTLCEARDKAPGMMRKLPAYVGRLFECLVSFLFDVEVCYGFGGWGVHAPCRGLHVP